MTLKMNGIDTDTIRNMEKVIEKSIEITNKNVPEQFHKLEKIFMKQDEKYIVCKNTRFLVWYITNYGMIYELYTNDGRLGNRDLRFYESKDYSSNGNYPDIKRGNKLSFIEQFVLITHIDDICYTQNDLIYEDQRSYMSVKPIISDLQTRYENSIKLSIIFQENKSQEDEVRKLKKRLIDQENENLRKLIELLIDQQEHENKKQIKIKRIFNRLNLQNERHRKDIEEKHKLKNKIKEMNRKIYNLEKELNEMNEDHHSKTIKIFNINEKLQLAYNDNTRLIKQLGEMDDAYYSQKSEIQTLISENDKLKKEMSEMDNAYLTQKKIIEKLKIYEGVPNNIDNYMIVDTSDIDTNDYK